jgi:hypothetical protein
MTKQPLLFPASEMPKAAIPVCEASQEWMDAQLLRSVEGIRFDEGKCAADVASVESAAPGGDRRGFLDFVIEQLGGRSQ